MNRPIMPPRPIPVDKHVYGEVSFWVKGEEARRMKNRRLSVIVRQGDRSNPETLQYVPEGVPVPVFAIAVPGDQAKGIAAQFEPDDGTTVQVIHKKICRLDAVLDRDLRYGNGGAVPEVAELVRDYLEHELVPGRTFKDEDMVTLYYIEYLPNAF